MPRYIEKVNGVRKLMTENVSNLTIVYALDAFSEYRIRVLTWLYEVKKDSLDKCKTSKKAPALSLATVVFRVFNNAQRKLLGIHEQTMETFDKSARKLFTNTQTKQHNTRVKVKELLDLLKQNLKKYENTILEARRILKAGLAFL